MDIFFAVSEKAKEEDIFLNNGQKYDHQSHSLSVHLATVSQMSGLAFLCYHYDGATL